MKPIAAGDTGGGFPFESELSTAIAQISAQHRLSTRRQALELVAAGKEWVSRCPDASLANRLETLESRIASEDSRTKAEWLNILQESRPNYPNILNALKTYSTYNPDKQANTYYVPDDLDYLLDTIMGIGPAHRFSPRREEELVHYEPAPASAILELICCTGLGPDDLFYDIGSGYGRVNALVSVATGARSVGVEIDRHLAEAAEHIVSSLGLLTPPEFVVSDAVHYDLAGAKAVFLFTPFFGSVLDSFLQSFSRSPGGACLCTFGSCTDIVLEHGGFACLNAASPGQFSLGVFRARN